ncbi:MAG TPA: SusE domain-containing protein [Lutibacter sp.]|nr:SusE domain-containing protein [Lutibacter sp.]
MKNIFKFLFLLALTVTAFSCDNEDQEQLTISPKGAGEITSPEAGTIYVLNPLEDQTNTILTITWNAADYDIPTQITYAVEFAKAGTSFAEPFKVGSTNKTNYSMNVAEFNGAAVSAGLAPFVQDGVDVRITSTVGSLGSTPQISEAITILVTPFTTDLPKISVPGNHQGWDPATAPTMAASAFGKSDYVGYVWLDGGHKFAAPNALGNFNWDLNWGDDGTFTGKLKVNATDNCTATAGFYYIKANTSGAEIPNFLPALSYSETPVSWGIIGAATPTGWDSDTDLVYSAASKTLSVNINLTAGGYKFRGNNEWGAFEFGSLNADGFLQAGGDFTFDGTPGNYHVVLDLSNPREYTYTLTPNF